VSVAPPLPFDPSRLPKHLAVIMDGNGRWAEARGLPRAAGHRAGTEVVNSVVRWCRGWGLRHLTLYAFSEQNWGRPEEEVGALMSLLVEYVREQREEILERRIRLRVIGDEGRLPAWVRGPLRALVEESARNEGMTLTLALSYGGREELARAARLLAEAVAAGELRPEEVTEERLSARLYAPDLPDPDLILRTSGERRLSNFLLWQCAYAELSFLDCAWPEVTAEALLEVLAQFATRERRFGLTGAQARAQRAEGGGA
jgi:undecaprenyl diphosphate synthase